MNIKLLKIVLSTATFILALHSCGQPEENKPDILLIVADDLGYADLSFLPFATEDVNTPNIDRIAENGTYFSNAYSTSPICSPSRVGMLTGKYQQRWGNYWYGEGGLPDTVTTIPQMLKSVGYKTFKIGKTHLNGGPVEHPLDHGFDEFLGFIDHTWDYLRLSQKDVDAIGKENADKAHIGPLIQNREKISFENGYTTDIFSDKAVEIIRKNEKNPLYIQLEYNAVHEPTYICHPEYLEQFGLNQFPFWDPDKEAYENYHYRNGYLGEIDPDGRKRYLLQLTVMDDGIGRILDALEETGKLENTIVIFLSDNGGDYHVYSNNAPLTGNKYMFAEGGIRIPFIVSWPDRYRGSNLNDALVSAMDIYPTLMEAVGINNEQWLDGLSLTPLLKNPKQTTHHEALFVSSGMNSYVVRKDNWRLNHYVGWSNHEVYDIVNGTCVRDTNYYNYLGGIRLINLDKDISETTDISSENPEITKELISLYKRWEKEMSPPRTRDGSLKPSVKEGDSIYSNLKKLGAQVLISNSRRTDYPGYAIDGLTGTSWRTAGGFWAQPLPHNFIIKTDKPQILKGIKILTDQRRPEEQIKNYTCEISMDGENWKLVARGKMDNTSEAKMISFDKTYEAKYINLKIMDTYNKEGLASIAEFDLIK